MALATLACGDTAATPDAAPIDADPADAAPPDACGQRVSYKLHLLGANRLGDAGISITINGEPLVGDSLSETFSSYEEARATLYSIETWFAEALLYRRLDSPGACPMLATGRSGQDTLVFKSLALCIALSGELRIGGGTCRYCQGVMLWDAFCPMACDPLSQWTPCEELKCGLVVTVHEPLYAFFDAVPAGQAAIGEACQRGAPGPETGYDDCASGGVCWEGQCRTMCSSQVPCANGGSCVMFPRMHDGIGWCRPGP